MSKRKAKSSTTLNTAIQDARALDRYDRERVSNPCAVREDKTRGVIDMKT